MLKESGIKWALNDKVIVTKVDDYYQVESFDDAGKVLLIAYNKQGRMLFDGNDIETEDYMAFVGLLDAANENPRNPAVIEADR